jgi:hypothetical protein
MGQRLFSPRTWRFMNQESHQRILGWSLLTISMLGLGSDLFLYQIVNIPYLVLLVIALWFIVRATNLFDESDTKQILRQKAHRQRVHTFHALHQHASPATRTIPKLSWKMALFLCSIVVLCTVGLVGLFAYEPTYFLLLLTLVAAGVLSLTFQSRSALWLLTSAGLLTMITLETIQLANATALNVPVLFFALATLSVTALFMVAFLEQAYHTYKMVVGSIVLLGSSYVLAWLWLTGLPILYRFEAGLLSLVGISLVAALFSWNRVQRNSFAKYLVVTAAIAFACYVYLFWGSVAVTLMWFTGAIAALSLGFLIPSYSARIVGLGALATTVLYYLVVIINEPLSIAGAYWTDVQVWLGSSLIAFLLVCWWWYGFVEPAKKEAQLVSQVRRACLTAVVACSIALLIRELPTVPGAVVSSCIALGLLWIGYRYRNTAAAISGFVLFTYGVLELFFTLTPTNDLLRFLVFLCLAILCGAGSILFARRP